MSVNSQTCHFKVKEALMELFCPLGHLITETRINLLPMINVSATVQAKNIEKEFPFYPNKELIR